MLQFKPEAARGINSFRLKFRARVAAHIWDFDFDFDFDLVFLNLEPKFDQPTTTTATTHPFSQGQSIN